MIRSFLRGLYSGPYATQLRRFVVVGTVAAGIQMILLWLLVDFGMLNYLIGAIIAIEFTIVLQYVLNNTWTFHRVKNTGTWEFFSGLVKTNVVRGSAIPIQLSVLFILVEWQSMTYLLANAIGIVVSGIYRFILDSRWTWGQ